MKKSHQRKIQSVHGKSRSSSAVVHKSTKKQVLGALIVVSLFLVLGFVGNCVSARSCSVASYFHAKKTVVTPKGKVQVEVVDTGASREKGLSGKKGLDKGEGMLFEFDKPGRYGFWMKDMLFAIDMIWINDDGLVVHIERNVKPDSYPTAYINTLEARYVLEIGANESEKFGLYMGAQVEVK